jgi:FAD/FMN-containing dehydrogenase
VTLDTLRLSCAGEVLVPGDDGYDTARAIWNGAIDKRPAVIVRCAATADVVAALATAHALGFEVSVRGGGHNFAGSALVDGGLTIDLSLMASVSVDAAKRRAVCGGGARWAELDAACQVHGLAVPGGFISHTGVGGLTLGGGIGWLTRKGGLSCDNLVSGEVVTASGAVVRASAEENADLFWAIRGGGGNFGVVTQFEFALHQVGPMVNLGFLFYGLDKGREVLTCFRDIAHNLPDDLNAFVGGVNAPPAPFVPEQFRFQPGYALMLIGLGDPASHAALIAPIRDKMAPLFELVTPIPYTHLQQMLDGSAPWGLLAYEKAVHLDELTDGAIDVIVDRLPKKHSPMSVVPIFSMGGAFARAADDAVAFGGRRSTRFIVNISAGAQTPDVLATEREWVREFWSALVPYAGGVGSYVNFMSEYEENRVRAAYGPAKYERLLGIKRKWDPGNTFHVNANIKP